jgi:hypothetical protein
MTLSGTVTATALRTDFDQHRATLKANARVGRKDQTRVMTPLSTLTSSLALSLRSYAWTQQDDQELRVLMIRGTTDGAATITLTLTVENDDETFLVDQAVTVSAVAGGAGTVDGRADYRTTTGDRLRLLKGVRYRLTVAVTAANWTAVSMCCQVRSIRRNA